MCLGRVPGRKQRPSQSAWHPVRALLSVLPIMIALRTSHRGNEGLGVGMLDREADGLRAIVHAAAPSGV